MNERKNESICHGSISKPIRKGLNDLWNLSINTFCNSEKAASASVESVKGELNQILPTFFLGGLEMCTKTKAFFELKDNAQPIFRPKSQVPFAARELNEKELDRLEKMEH